MTKTFEELTREVFHNIHLGQLQNGLSFSRLASQLSEEYLELPSGYFLDKHCLDAGCGSNVSGTLNLLNLGARHVTAFDLNGDFFEVAHKVLEAHKDRYSLEVGDVTEMKYEDESFDFVLCGGVLHHTRSVRLGVKELCRVLKNGGHIHIYTYGSGGLIRQITGFLRDRYTNDPAFRKTVDDLTVELLRSEVDRIIKSMLSNRDSYANLINVEMVKELIDLDLVLTIKDRIQAPTYMENEMKEMVQLLGENGIRKIKRITRYPTLKNLRRFLAPYYYEYDHPVAKFLYGDGVIQLVGMKDIS